MNINTLATNQAQVFDGINREGQVMHHTCERHRAVYHVELPNTHRWFPLEIVQATRAIRAHDAGGHIRNHIQVIVILKQEFCRVRLIRQRVSQSVVIQHYPVSVVTQLPPQVTNLLMINCADRSDLSDIVVRLPHVDSENGYATRIGCRTIRYDTR